MVNVVVVFPGALPRRTRWPLRMAYTVMSENPWFSTRTVVRGCGIAAERDFEPPHPTAASPSIVTRNKRRVDINSSGFESYPSLETGSRANVPRRCRPGELNWKMSWPGSLFHERLRTPAPPSRAAENALQFILRPAGDGVDKPSGQSARSRSHHFEDMTSSTRSSAAKRGRSAPAAKRQAQPSNKYFVLRGSAIQGQGAFATRPIRRGTRIIEYTGERISHDEADRRYDDGAMGRHHTFLFTIDRSTVIDAAVNGNDARFINHSCAPNCEAIDERKRIYIEAIRDIASGEELTYDYAYERDGTEDEEWERLYMCKCGAPTCRGTILAPMKKRGKK